MADEIEFVDGLIVKAPREGAPDFVKAAISIKVADLRAWLSQRSEDWVNIDVKEAKSGRWYAAVNTYKPKEGKQETKTKPAEDFTGIDDDIPF